MVDINKINKIFVKFYGKKYEKLINERLNSFIGIVFYSKKNIVPKLNSGLVEYINLYEITNFKKEILNKKIPFSKYVVEHGCQGMIPFIRNNKLKTVIYFPRKEGKFDNYDCILIHEFLHVLDEHLITKNVSKGGFDTINFKKNKQRNFEWFNEMIHQHISEEITEFAHNNNIYLFNTKEEAYRGKKELHDDRNIVIETFYKYFKEDILICKLMGDLEGFIEIIGEENFINLNEWIKMYYKKYPTPEIRKTAKNSKNHIDDINNGLQIINQIIKHNNVKI